MRVLALLTLLPVAAQGQEPSGDRLRGEAWYVDYGCYACHGYNGTGETPLSSETSGILSSQDLFIRYLRLRTDQNPINPKRSMPNYSTATLGDDRAADIYAYLLTLDDDPPAVDDIPAFIELIEHAREDPEFESDKK